MRKFLHIGICIAVQDDAYMMAMSASLFGTRDVAAGFSHTGVTLEALQIARRSGPGVSSARSRRQASSSVARIP